MENWYVLHTKPQAEYRVADLLQQRRLETYLPEVEVSKASQPQKKVPFFPCYLFVKVDFETVSLSKLQWLSGLRRFVTFENEQPISVPEQVIALLKYKLGEVAVPADQPKHVFQPGDPVEIVDGPFKGRQAIFQGSATPAERVAVLLEILGSISRVHVSASDLKTTTSATEVTVSKRPRRTRGRGRRIKQKS